MPPGGHQLWPFCTLINAKNDTFFNRYAQNYDQSGWTNYSGVFHNYRQCRIMCFQSTIAVDSSELFTLFLRNAPFSHLNTFEQAARPTYHSFTIKNSFFTLQTCSFCKFQCNIWPPWRAKLRVLRFTLSLSVDRRTLDGLSKGLPQTRGHIEDEYWVPWQW